MATKRKKLRIGGDPDEIELEVILVKVVKSPWERAAEFAMSVLAAIAAFVIAHVYIFPLFG